MFGWCIEAKRKAIFNMLPSAQLEECDEKIFLMIINNERLKSEFCHRGGIVNEESAKRLDKKIGFLECC